jgi:hypothetical protein
MDAVWEERSGVCSNARCGPGRFLFVSSTCMAVFVADTNKNKGGHTTCTPLSHLLDFRSLSLRAVYGDQLSHQRRHFPSAKHPGICKSATCRCNSALTRSCHGQYCAQKRSAVAFVTSPCILLRRLTPSMRPHETATVDAHFLNLKYP